MSLAVTLNNALTGLNANQTAISVTSSNVANVNTEGYSRKIHQQATRVVAGDALGVETADIIRRVDQFLRRDLMQQTTVIGEATVNADYLNRMQQLFGSVGSDNALGNSVNSLTSALEDLATSPEVASARFTAIDQATALARRVTGMADQVQDLRAQADTQISEAVDLINAQLEAIAKLNADISTREAQGKPIGELQDERDQAIKLVREYVGVFEVQQSDGQITLMSEGGRSLVQGSSAATLSYTRSNTMVPSTTYPGTISGIFINGGATPPASADITGQIQSGRLKALIDMRDTTLPAMTEQLDQFSAALRDEVNRAHNRGANTPLGFGTGAADAPVMWGSRAITTPTDPLTLGHDVQFAILDADGNAVIPATSIAAGATTPNAIQAAMNAYLTTAPGYGTATFVNDRLEIKMEPGYRLAILDQGPAADMGDATIQFDADGDTVQETYNGFSSFFGLNDLFQTPELGGSGFAMTNQGSSVGISSGLQVRQDIIDNPDNLSRGMLRGTFPDLSLGVGDNEIAQQLAAAFSTNYNFASIADGPSSISTTIGGYANTILSFAGAQTAAADQALTYETFLFEDINNKFLGATGVNMDEELANLTIFQNAYSASARVVQTVNELFDEIINLR